MELTELQQKFETRARKRFVQDHKDAIKALAANPILSRIVLKAHTQDLNLGRPFAHSLFHGDNNGPTHPNILLTFTNFAEIEADLVAQYVKQETDAFVAKLDELKDLMNDEFQD